jgi:1-acyl-sn-glycerol-3-phosphate acyltransferase
VIRTLLVALVKLVSGAQVRWVGALSQGRQCIYFANHTSHLDAVVLWAALPPEARNRTRPVAAREYWEASRLRRYLAVQIFDAILIDRERVRARNNPVRIIADGAGDRCSLIIFPEGGRGFGTEIGPFKSGLYHLARARPGMELVPVFIDNLNRILPKGEFLPVPLLSSISFGCPMHLGADEPKGIFLERARKAVYELRRT